MGRAHAKSTDGLPAAGAYRIDPVHSFAQFAVKHLIVGRVDRRFNAIEGSVVVTEEPERLFDRVDVDVDAASIDTNFEMRDLDATDRPRRWAGDGTSGSPPRSSAAAIAPCDRRDRDSRPKATRVRRPRAP